MPLQYTKHSPGDEQFRIGVVRDSMNRNELIIKQRPLLGTATARAFDLPKSKTFTHGVKNYYVDGGVSEIMKQPIQMAPPSEKRRHEKRRDYVALNRAAVQTGIVSAQEQKQFRMQHNIWQKDPVEYRHAKNLVLPHDFTHGMANRPGTPVDTILRFQFQKKWVKDQVAEQGKRQARALNQQELTVERAFENKASRLRKTKVSAGLRMSRDALWQMPKWNNVPAHISSFRSKTAYDKAFMGHKQDMQTRVGPIGQGIYTVGNLKA